MSATPTAPTRPSRSRVAISLAAALLLLPGCTDAAVPAAGSDVALFDAQVVHDIDITFDAEDYDAMVEAFRESGDKEWISGTVTTLGDSCGSAGPWWP